jgi:hypothetical protein
LQKEADIRKRDSTDSLGLLGEASGLAKTATGSQMGAAADATQAFFGGTNEGAKAASQLKIVGGYLTSKVPKMSGPQSDKDAALYREMAGSLGDATVPNEIKEANIAQMKALHQKYVGDNPELKEGNTSQQDNPEAGYAWATNPKTGERIHYKVR